MKHYKRTRVLSSLLDIPQKPLPKELVVNALSDNKGISRHNSRSWTELFSKDDIRNLADLATNLWRARQRIAGLSEKGSFAAESKRILRPIESAMESLESIGIRIEDLTGKPFVPGMALNVVSSQPNSSVSADRIAETLKPTVYFRDQFIQAGDVIIEGPPSSKSLGKEQVR